MTAGAKRRECYRVADLQIDVGAMLVLRGREELALPPLSFELLVLLVRRAPDVVTRDEIMQVVWRDVVVGPPTLKQRVKLLRQSLDDDPRDPRYIATVRGRGYRLIPAPSELATSWPARLGERLKGILDGASKGNRVRKAGIAAIAGLALLATGTGQHGDVAADTPETGCDGRLERAGATQDVPASSAPRSPSGRPHRPSCRR